MKDVSDDYIVQEEAPKKKPLEFYHFWRDGGEHWYNTSGDVAVPFDCGDGNGIKNYVPATLNRSLVSYDSVMNVSKLTIYAGYLEIPIIRFIAQNPVEKIWISVMRAHRDMVPLEADVVFIGQIKSVSFKGVQANAECVGFEHFLSMPIPKYRYQPPCNWQLFESLTIGGVTMGCLLIKVSYRVTTNVTVDSTGKILTSAAFDAYDDGYFIRGTVEHGDEKRPIVDHVGSNVTIAYKMMGLLTEELVDAYPGCDGRVETCRDKFMSSNIDHFFGMPWIPEENPATRVP